MEETKDEILIYRSEAGPEIKVKFEGDTVWLTQGQVAELFGVNIPAVSKHINNIYKEAELSRNSTVSKMETVQNEGNRTIKRVLEFYNLDVVIAVGYRVNSKRATQFRIWATQRLRDYILKGFVVNQERLKEQSQVKLKELEGAVKLLQGAIESHRLDGYEKELLKIITDYTETWVLLNKYDHDALEIEKTTKKIVYRLDHERITKSISQFKKRLVGSGEASDLFGREVGHKLKGLLGNIEQTFDGTDVYGSVEEKAAHVLYFVIKDHPFVDGNKRIGSLLFLLFLIENRIFYNKRGERKLNDNALAALALLVAESKPEQKNSMVKLIVNLVNKK